MLAKAAVVVVMVTCPTPGPREPWGAWDDSEWELQKDRLETGCEERPFPAGQAPQLVAQVSFILLLE